MRKNFNSRIFKKQIYGKKTNGKKPIQDQSSHSSTKKTKHTYYLLNARIDPFPFESFFTAQKQWNFFFRVYLGLILIQFPISVFPWIRFCIWFCHNYKTANFNVIIATEYLFVHIIYDCIISFCMSNDSGFYR